MCLLQSKNFPFVLRGYFVVVSMEITTLKFSIEKIWRTFKLLQ